MTAEQYLQQIQILDVQIQQDMEQLDGNDSLTVNLIREIVTNLRGGEHDES